ncbi:hypothetical protein EVAR_64588_1 [Eumeta japonica]|uniref:Craniofacial development protein 2 n=1 Tax=Eumeta variegata TaxID=151549 RepID=A0A4C1Z4X9_EUMVA|nr:hypothetical protein EVAR_64588_1 [Eumeta japonica]
MKVSAAHCPLPSFLLSTLFSFIRYPIPSQEAFNALATPLELGLSMGGGVYAPDMSKSLEERKEFWAVVRDILVNCDRNKRIVILNDFNGLVGVLPDGYEKVLEGYSYNWWREEDKSKIDFIIVNDRLRSKVMGTRVYRGANIGTDHFLVVCRIKALCQHWRHHAKMVTTELELIKVGKLQDQNIKYEYVERLKDSLGEIIQYECLELDELWKVMKSVLVDKAKKIFGVNKRTNVSKKDNEWRNFEVKKVVNEK